ncbi:MAG: tRNA lysidine(34) synthetase TilS [Aquificae bacterium]|nr:tRNA lysidine(34) synthetase TilS [Aquificota bacterium]
MDLEKKFLKAQSDFSLFSKNDKVVVAFSGGVDSTVLTYLLLKFKEYLGLSDIILAHINHMLRGKESDEEERFCREFAQKHNLKIEILRVDINSLAQREKKSIEFLARQVRYSFLEEIRKKYNAEKIATGHHLSDLAETMTLWFIQGNKKGVKGFKPKENRIVRPLYYALKEEIKRYAKEKNILYKTDSSNESLDYLRNKVRKLVIPKMKLINPSLENSLMVLSYFLSLDEEYLQKEAERLFEMYVHEDYIDTKEIPTPILYRLLQKWVYEKTGIYLSYATVLDILNMIKKGGTKTIYISDSVSLVKEYDKLFIKSITDSEKRDFEYKFKVGQSVYIKEAGIVLNSYIVDKGNIKNLKDEKKMVCFDIPDFSNDEEFIVRNRREGDRFLPFGKSTEKKLKDVMIELKIPKNMRESIPVLVFRDKILWIIGYKRSGYFPVNEKSAKLVCFEVKEVKNAVL